MKTWPSVAARFFVRTSTYIALEPGLSSTPHLHPKSRPHFMPSAAQSTTDEVAKTPGDPTGEDPGELWLECHSSLLYGESHISLTGPGNRTLQNAKVVVKTAVDVLGVVAEVTENVPYLGAISTAVTGIIKILDVRRLSPLAYQER